MLHHLSIYMYLLVSIFSCLFLQGISQTNKGDCSESTVESPCCYNFRLKDDKCIKCSPGYFGIDCMLTCPGGRYGHSCLQRCTTCKTTDCHHVYGCNTTGVHKQILKSKRKGRSTVKQEEMAEIYSEIEDRAFVGRPNVVNRHEEKSTNDRNKYNVLINCE
ncbi:uncharacterized protein LOC130051841 isoform X2 [Ostrea edulis]|uniref:uncharacterized protein LOC130051841 isoform X2 n=1 Tax=Ostrea edulis TaxID=37623 RepID=UPI0024AF7E57|nr:uncharacterized protein LOC130051841 isoform X2 [Ostrea edulis]